MINSNPFFKTASSMSPISPSAKALQPYVQDATEQKADELNLMQPVQWIFDLLSRGQYLTANVAEEITKSIRDGEPLGMAARDALKGAMDGITGSRKGDWETTLFGGKDQGEEDVFSGLFPDSNLPTWAKKVIGFAANVALDPTTYVGFGPTRAAKAGAQKYAGEAVQTAVKKFADLGELSGLARQGFDQVVFKELLGQSSEKAMKYLGRFKTDMSREMDKVYRSALKEGARLPEAELQKKLLGQLDTFKAKGGERFNAGVAADNIGEQIRAKTYIEDVQDIVDRVMKGYGETGERAMKFGPMGIGAELFKGTRYPQYLQAFDKIGETIGQSPMGSKFSDAWWAVQNKGPIGELRKWFGVKNPYQSFLNVKKRDAEQFGEGVATKLKNDFVGIYRNTDPETINQGMDVIRLANQVSTEGNPVTAEEILEELVNPTVGNPLSPAKAAMVQGSGRGAQSRSTSWITRLYGDKLFQNIKDPLKVKNFLVQHKNFTDTLQMRALEIQQELGVRESGYVWNYLPTVVPEKPGLGGKVSSEFKGSSGAGFQKPRTYTSGERLEQETANIMWIYGVDNEVARRIAQEKGVSNISTDYAQMMLNRIQAQARFEKHADIVRKFKDFGFDMGDKASAGLAQTLKLHDDTMEEYLGAQLNKAGTFNKQLGIRQVQGKPFEGKMYDTEVADILERATQFTSDPGMKSLGKLWNGFTGWWKGFITMTTGFHVRNAVSNEFTGWLTHGMGWFDPRLKKEAMVGTIYALAKDNPGELLKKINMSKGEFMRTLKSRSGSGLSIMELSDYAYNKGVISTATQAFDPESMLKQVQGAKPNLNPLSSEFAGIKGSRAIGNVVENSARFQSMLMDYRTIMGKDLKATMTGKALNKQDIALEWAKNNARKTFLDYGDLTDVERKVFRNVVPFYSWIRKNLANQIAYVVTDPSMYANIPKLQEAIGVDPEIDMPAWAQNTGLQPEDFIPEWMRSIGMISVGKDATGKPLMLNPNLPYQDLNKIPFMFSGSGAPTAPRWREIVDDLMSAAHPALKQVVQLIPEKGYDIFYKRDLDYSAKAPYLLRFFTKSPKMIELMDGLARNIGIEDGIKAGVDENGILRIDAKMAKVMEDNLPILRAMERVMLLAGSVIPGLDKAIEGATGAKNDYEGMEKFFQLLSYWGGIKFKLADVEAEKKRIAEDIYNQAQAKKKGVEKYTPLATKRKLQYNRATDTKLRRVGL